MKKLTKKRIFKENALLYGYFCKFKTEVCEKIAETPLPIMCEIFCKLIIAETKFLNNYQKIQIAEKKADASAKKEDMKIINSFMMRCREQKELQ